MPRCSSRSARTSAKRGMFCIANANVPPCQATSIVASVRFASCTVRTNEAIRSGNVHSVLLKNTRTYRGPSAITLASRPERSGGGPLMSANTCWLNCTPKPPNQLTRPWSRASVNSGGAVAVPAPSAGPGAAMTARLAAIAQPSVGTRATPKRRIPGRHPTTHAPFTVMAGNPVTADTRRFSRAVPPGARGPALLETTYRAGLASRVALRLRDGSEGAAKPLLKPLYFRSLFDSMSAAARAGSCRSVSIRVVWCRRSVFERDLRDVSCQFVTMRSVAEWLHETAAGGLTYSRTSIY